MKRISKRKKALCLFLIGNLLPVCYVCWMCFAPPEPIEISAETTFLTAPLTADGRHIDYLGHTKEQIGDHHYSDDLWKALVPTPTHWDDSSEKALGQVPEVSYKDPRKVVQPSLILDEAGWRTDKRYEARLNSPYSSESDSIYSSTVRENEAWYLAVLQTEPGPVAANLYNRTLSDVGLPISEVHATLAVRFALRASLAFGEGRFEDAIQTLRFIDKVAKREKTLPFRLSQQTGSNIVYQNINTAYYGILASDAIPSKVLHEFDAYGAEQTNWNSWTRGLQQDRIALLQTLSEAHRTRGQSDDFDKYFEQFGRGGGNWFVRRIDFNSAMRLTNSTYDKAITAFQIKDTQQSLAALQKIGAEVSTNWPEPPATLTSDPTLPGLIRGDHNGYAHHYATDNADIWFYEILRTIVAHHQNSRKRLRLAVRLHVFRQRFGNWPDSLDELTQLRGWHTPATLLKDSSSDEPIRYRRTDDGFLLWSVGLNRIDDCNGTVPEDWPKDYENDGDDDLWPWPDPRVQWDPEDDK